MLNDDFCLYRDIERKSLEEKEWNYLESLCVDKPDCQLKLQNLKEIDREIHSVLSEIKKRYSTYSRHHSDPNYEHSCFIMIPSAA